MDAFKFGAGLADSIKQFCRNNGLNSMEELTHIALKSFITRVSRYEESRNIILKGGMMLVCEPLNYLDRRSTKDLDLHIYDLTPAQLDDLIMAASQLTGAEAEDGFEWELSRKMDLPHSHHEDKGTRYYFAAYLGRDLSRNIPGTRVSVHVDVGFGGAMPAGIKWGNVVAHSKLPVGRMLMQPYEYAVADKIMASVDHGVDNSRLKDFVDLWAYSKQGVDANRVFLALNDGYSARGLDFTSKLPVGLSDAYGIVNQSHWEVFLDKHKLTQVPRSMYAVLTEIRQWLQPIYDMAPEAQLTEAYSYTPRYTHD